MAQRIARTDVRLVFKIVYPNGKIYVGKDLTNSINYFGSANSRIIEEDFLPEQRRTFSVIRETLWESRTATDAEVSKVEVEFIRALQSNNPEVGYNRWPLFRPSSVDAEVPDKA